MSHSYVRRTQTGNLTDSHAIVAGRPVTDECTQDWNLLSADVGVDGLIFEVERALNTGDTQDHVFVDDCADGASVASRLATPKAEEGDKSTTRLK